MGVRGFIEPVSPDSNNFPLRAPLPQTVSRGSSFENVLHRPPFVNEIEQDISLSPPPILMIQ